jgi:serine/threonine protein kinase
MNHHQTANSDPIGQVIDQKFRVLSKLGSGGLGVVYLAQQEGLGRTVAVKFLRPDVDEELTERFRNEAKVLASVSHPNVLAGYAQGVWNGSLFIVCELIDGETLEMVLARRECMPWQEAFAICAQAAQALHSMHSSLIIHRDIKPSNIMLTSTNVVKLIDLGLCQSGGIDRQKLTVTGSFVGTPHYASPELIMGKPITPAADVYALGCVLFELITGKRLVEPASIDDALKIHLTGVTQTLAKRCPELPEHALDVMAVALAREPEQRFGSAADFASHLSNAIAEDKQPGTPASRPLAESRGTSFSMILTIAVLSVCLLVAAWALWRKSMRNSTQALAGGSERTVNLGSQEPRAIALARRITGDTDEQSARAFIDALIAFPTNLTADQADVAIKALGSIDSQFGCAHGWDLLEHRQMAQKMIEARLWKQMIDVDQLLIKGTSSRTLENEDVAFLILTIERLQDMKQDAMAQNLVSRTFNGSLIKKFQRYVRQKPLTAQAISDWLVTLDTDAQSQIVYNLCAGVATFEGHNFTQSTQVLDKYFEKCHTHSRQLDQARDFIRAYHYYMTPSADAASGGLAILQKELAQPVLNSNRGEGLRADMERMTLSCILNTCDGPKCVQALDSLIELIEARDPHSDFLTTVRRARDLSLLLWQEKASIASGDRTKINSFMVTVNDLIDQLRKDDGEHQRFALTQRTVDFIAKYNIKNEESAQLVNHYLEMLSWHMYTCFDPKRLALLLPRYDTISKQLADFLPAGETRMLRVMHAPLSIRVLYYDLIGDRKNRERVCLAGLALVQNCTSQAGIAERIDDRVRLEQLWCAYHDPERAEKYHVENLRDIERNKGVLGHIVNPMLNREADHENLIRAERKALHDDAVHDATQ